VLLDLQRRTDHDVRRVVGRRDPAAVWDVLARDDLHARDERQQRLRTLLNVDRASHFTQSPCPATSRGNGSVSVCAAPARGRQRNR
jgi:hypothetical protein